MAYLLLVDEDRDSCQLAKRVLSREGHIAEALAMPQEALAWLGANVPSLAIASAGKYGEKARALMDQRFSAGADRRGGSVNQS